MTLDRGATSCKVDSPAKFPPAAIELKSHAVRYIMANFAVSPSLANTIAALAMLGGAQ